MRLNAVSFGKITIVDPQTTNALAAELRGATNAGFISHATTPVLDKIKARRLENSGNEDNRLVLDSFVPTTGDESLPGVYPGLGERAKAGLFPLREGWGAVVTNDGARVQDISERRRPELFDDLNHLVRMLRRDERSFRDPVGVVSDFVANEKGLRHKQQGGPKDSKAGPVVQLDLRG